MIAPAAIVMSGGGACFAMQYLTVEEAQKLCFADATEFTFSDLKLSQDQKKAIEKSSGVRVRLSS